MARKKKDVYHVGPLTEGKEHVNAWGHTGSESAREWGKSSGWRKDNVWGRE